MTNLNGRLLKGYWIHEPLGAGGYGKVYRAYQASVGRDVAIKVILPRYANHPDFIRRFEAEAQLIASLEHAHIVPLYDYWRDAGGAYLVMRWLPSNLRTAMGRSAWPIESTARLLDQLAMALALAHRREVVHRDIKPENILLDEDNNAYLADFGIAREVDSQSTSLETGEGSTSPAYVSPEQIRHEPITPATDIYSLGMVIYELLTGQTPYSDAKTPTDFLQKHLSSPLPKLNFKHPQAAALNEVVQTATAKDPAKRYTSAVRFAAAFRAAMSHGTPLEVEQPLVDPLTPRELEILQLMARDQSTRDIAEKLFLSIETVRWNYRQIYSKLDVHSRQDAIDRAHALRLIKGDPSNTPIVITPNEAIPPVAAIPPVSLTARPRNPYKGIRAFQEADSSDFFGRAGLVTYLMNRLAETDEYSRFLAVVGPSGSGKSSIVYAGLLPELRKGALLTSPPYIVDMLPGVDPFAQLAAALERVASIPAAEILAMLQVDHHGLLRVVSRILPTDRLTELILVINQFEELFTHLADDAIRASFFDTLLTAVTDPQSRIRVIVTLRADFYDRPLLYPRLAEVMRQRTAVIVPMSSRELEAAITQPAVQVGVQFEPGLVATIITEVGEQPGILPLLQYALTELFEYREGQQLTLDAYRRTGGVLGALAQRADSSYDALTEQEQAAARQLFLRLILLGEGTEDTRRRVPLTELTSLEGVLSENVISTFAESRLLTFDRDPLTHSPTVEITHEALIREWGLLREWLNTSRDALRVQRRLATAASEWASADREPGFLATGSRLDQFEIWHSESDLSLTPLEYEYLSSSLAERQRQLQAEQARKAREEQTARRAQNFWRASIGLAITSIIAVLLIIATTIALSNAQREVSYANTQVDAAGQTQTPAQATIQAGQTQVAIAQTRASEAEIVLTPAVATLTAVDAEINDRQRLSESLRLAAAANNVNDPQLAMLLAVRGLKQHYSPQADQALIRALVRDERQFQPSGDSNLRSPTERRLLGHTDDVYTITFSPDGKQLASAGNDRVIRIWDVVTGQLLRTFTGHEDSVTRIQFSADGRQLLSSGDMTVRLWDVATSSEIRTFTGHTDVVYFASFSPDNRRIASSSADRTIRLWDTASGQEIRTFTGHTNNIYSAVFSADGSELMTASEDSTVRFWDVSQGTQLRSILFASPVKQAVYSPDGRLFAVGTFDATAYIMERNSGLERQILRGHSFGVYGLAFSPDGRLLLTGSRDTTARLWQVSTGEELRTFSAHDDQTRTVAFSPDGKLVATGSWDQTVRLWDVDYRDFVTFVCTRIYRDLTPQERIVYSVFEGEATCPQFSEQPQLAALPTTTPIVHMLPNWTAIPSPTLLPQPTLSPSDVLHVPLGTQITLDGDLTDWAGIEFKQVTHGPLLSPNPVENGSFRFAVTADAETLYVAMMMPDQNIVAGKHGIDYWLEDSFDVFLNLTNNLNTELYAPGIFQVNFNATNLDSDEPIRYSVRVLDKYSIGVEAQAVTFSTEDGWGVEAAIPLVGLYPLEPGAEIGFQIHANGATQRDHDVKLIWSSLDTNDESWRNPSLFGRIIFESSARM
jgi:serine/threonine protein kinase/dipeptidyl aminopeptidase/acylaminoacyl peptidase